MANEKIQVSWADLRRPEIDQKLQQQAALQRAEQHYQQAPAAPIGEGRRGLWYNSLFYMTAFGLLGGLIGALGGEAAYQAAMPARVAEYEAIGMKLYPLRKNYEQGNISEAEMRSRVAAIVGRYANNPYIVTYFNPDLSESQGAARIAQLQEEDGLGRLKATFGLFVSAGIAIAVALAIAEPVTERNGRLSIINGSVALSIGAVGAVVTAIGASLLYSTLGGGEDVEITFRQVVARALAWCLLGAFLAIAPGIVLKSWKRTLIGFLGGAVGGLLGGLLFDPISIATQSVALSRILGITAIGLLAGVGTGLIENVAKTGWLRVVAGLIAGKQFILYKNPTTIGSSPQCDIYLFKDPQISPLHAAIHRVGGGYEIEDRGSVGGTFVDGRPVKRARLRNNTQVQIGATTLLFQEKEQQGG